MNNKYCYIVKTKEEFLTFNKLKNAVSCAKVLNAKYIISVTPKGKTIIYTKNIITLM